MQEACTLPRMKTASEGIFLGIRGNLWHRACTTDSKKRQGGTSPLFQNDTYSQNEMRLFQKENPNDGRGDYLRNEAKCI
jgi:hypothetical protein